MNGMLVTSKMGHDKGQIYIIIKEENEYVYLVDGRIRTLSNSKKKNKKHVQIINKTIDSSILVKLQNGTARDEEIKREIKLYQQTI